MEKIRNKNYQISKLAVGDRFTHLGQSEAYEIIGFVEKKMFPQNLISKVNVVKASEVNKMNPKISTKEPTLIVTFLRSTDEASK